MVRWGGIAALALAWMAGGCLFAPPPAGVDDGDGGAGDDAGVPDSGGEPGADAALEPGFMRCPLAPSVPTLDGVDEVAWSGAPPLQLDVAQAGHTADLNANYTRDATATARCLHAPLNLYFFIEVVDGLTVSTRPIQVDGPDLREDDAVVLFLHADDDELGAYDGGDHAIVLPAQEGDAAALAADFGPDPLAPAGWILTDEGGYRIEIAVARDAIATPAADRFRVNLALIDDDGWNDTCRDVFALTSQPVAPCIECCPGEDWTASCPGYSAGEALAWCDTRVSQPMTLE
jgi:hypothetical protein